MVAITDRQNLRPLIKKLIQVKTGIGILLFIIGIPILLYMAAHFISVLSFEGNLDLNLVDGLKGIPIWVLLALPFGPMGEELGWRGYMLPKLLEKHSIATSTIYVGLAWGIWHLASFTFPGAAIPDFLQVTVWSVSLFILYTISLSFIYSFVYLKTNGSVFYAILLHAFFNAASNIALDFFGETETTSILVTGYMLDIVFAGVIGFILIRRHQRKTSPLS